jgi:predicted nucleic acid-binding protein
MVIDTNVVAYAIFGPQESRVPAWKVLRSADTIAVPDLFFSEYASAVWQWARATNVGVVGFVAALDDAEALVDRIVPVQQLWRSALGLALRHGHPVYDSVFAALAEKLDTRVVTFDGRFLRAFPKHTLDARSFSAGSD